MAQDYYKSGDINAICDRCGVKMKMSTLQKTWDGLMVCPADFEPRHIADFIKAPRTIPSRPVTRPEGADVSVGPTYISESTGDQETTIPTGTPHNAGTL